MLRRSDTAAAVEREGARYTVVEGGLRYEYQAVLGIETLVDTRSATPRADLRAVRPGDVVRLRARLLEDVGADSLECVRAAHEPEIAALRSLGYR